MKMRELERRTGVNREVIRILIREGLLPEPQRPARNAAEYDEAHVRGVAAVRQLQQSSRMTLKEIKVALEAGGLDRTRPAGTLAHLDTLLAGLFGIDSAPPVEVAALTARSAHARRDVEAFQRLGMLKVRRRADDEAELLTLFDARLVEIWSMIRDAGFVEEAGFPPDNIAFYLEAARYVAGREVDVFLDNNRLPMDDSKAAQMLHVALPLMTDFFGLLRLKCFMQILAERLAPVD